jgi:hypothetical protein
VLWQAYLRQGFAAEEGIAGNDTHALGNVHALQLATK